MTTAAGTAPLWAESFRDRKSTRNTNAANTGVYYLMSTDIGWKLSGFSQAVSDYNNRICRSRYCAGDLLFSYLSVEFNKTAVLFYGPQVAFFGKLGSGFAELDE